jgi:hypothetical protein
LKIEVDTLPLFSQEHCRNQAFTLIVLHRANSRGVLRNAG